MGVGTLSVPDFLLWGLLFYMKEYFSHDYKARSDRKLQAVMMRHGLSGIGAYWCVLEMLYEEGGELPKEYERISFELRTDCDTIKSIIEDFELFTLNGETFTSESALNRLNLRIEKSNKARESVNKRWQKYERNTNVIQKTNERNTIKEKKRKEKDISKQNPRDLKIFGYKPKTEDEIIKVEWLKNTYPRIQSLHYYLIPPELEILINHFGKDKVLTKLDAMENKKTLLKDYIDAYKTLTNWLKLDQEREVKK